MTPPLLFAGWPASDSVIAAVSTRHGGCSTGKFSSLNLGFHVQDDPDAVTCNRNLFKQALPEQPVIQWLNQVHGKQVQVIDIPNTSIEPPQADALYTRQSGIALAVMTADCLPVCFATKDGAEIAIAHAGWRGLVKGVLESTLGCFIQPMDNVIAWFGPAIGQCHFEVGEEVRAEFIESVKADNQAAIKAAFAPSVNAGRWMADLYSLAQTRLKLAGIASISGGGSCTVCDSEQFYSYRKTPETGRFATVIYRR